MSLPLPSLMEGTHSVQIIFSEEPPTNLFCDEWFEIGVTLQVPASLRETHGNSSSPLKDISNTALHLTPVLHHNNQNNASGSSILQNDRVQVFMDPPTISFQIGSSQGDKASARCRVHCPIDNLVPTKYCLSFVESWGPPQSPSLQPPQVGVKCTLSRPMHFVNAKLKLEPGEWEETWYKDMGGRDKAMQTVVSMYGRDGLPVKKRKVPLYLTLLYDNEKRSPVMKQDILRMIGPNQNCCLEEESGKSTMQFRIEDVSKNHQGQSFMIQIAPDSEKDPDIAPAFSRTVCVKSKMKKRKRNSGGAPENKPGVVSNNSPSSTPLTIAIPAQNAQRLRQAMSGVIKWTEEVVNGLFPLKWQVLGYGQFPDGSIDYNRPYHNMPNPNDCIHRILSMYADDTRENLRVLLSAVEQTTNQDMNNSQAADMYPQSSQNQEPSYPAKRRGTFNEYSQNDVQGFNQPQSYNPNGMTGMVQPPQGMMGHQQHPSLQQPWMQQHNPNKLPHLQPSLDEQAQEDSVQRTMDEENRQADVQYVLAKQFKSCRTHNRLGFPAFSITKELLGFYKKSSVSIGARFVPIYKHRQEFGPTEMAQATRILEDAVAKRSMAVKDLKDWESLSSMVDNALMADRESNNALSYDWSKDFGDHSNSSGDGEIGMPVLGSSNNSPF